MKVRTAVITAAGARQRTLPLQTLVDRDGVSRTVLSILVREVLKAKIERVCVVVFPGDQEAYANAVPDQRNLLHFVEQTEPLGYGDALLRSRDYLGGEPFLHLVGDHVYLGSESDGCAAELVSIAEAEACAVSAVRPTHERFLASFGVVGGQAVAQNPRLLRVETVLEKPTPTVAEQKAVVAGLRAGHYLAFFGMHVLTPTVFDLLESLAARGARPTLSDALHVLPRKERYLALQVGADRYDLGARYGLLYSQLALALNGRDRDEVLTSLVMLLAKESVRA